MLEVEPEEELVVVTPDAEVVELPSDESDDVVAVDVVPGAVVVATVVGAVVGVVVVVVLDVARNNAAAAATTIITTTTTAITIRLIASALTGLFFLGLGEDTKIAMTIALFRSCYHLDARYRPAKVLISHFISEIFSLPA